MISVPDPPAQPQLLDWAALFCVCAAAAIPYRALFGMPLLGVTVYPQEILLLATVAVATILIILRGLPTHHRTICAAAVTLLVLVIAFQIARAVWCYESLYTLLSHGRTYLPFLAATALISCRLQLGVSRACEACCLALLASAMASVATLALAPDLPRVLMGPIEAVESSESSGRMFWTGGDLALIAPLVLVAKPHAPQLFRWTALTLISTALLLGQNRTLLVAYALIWVILSAVRLPSISSRLLALMSICLCGGLAATAFFRLASDNAIVTLTHRLGLMDAPSELDRALTDGRLPLYEQYADILKSNWLVGQGLGVPLSILRDGTPVYTADVSLISFSAPFGLAGLAVFITTVYAIWGRARLADIDRSAVIGIRVIVLVALGVSFNYDVWTRNMFVVALALVVASSSERRYGPTSKSLTVMSDPRFTRLQWGY